MIIDLHGHIGNINQAPFWAADARRLDEALDQCGVDALCVSSAKAIMYDTREGNADLARDLKVSRKLLGYVVANPVFPESIRDLDLLGEDKFVGVKIHPDYHGYDIASPSVRSFLDDVAAATRLVLSHVSCMPGTGFAAAEKVAELAARHPKTNFILAHLGGLFQNPIYPYFPNFEGLERVAAMGLENVYVDTSQHLMYVYPGVMERAVEILGAAKLVFGTDMPLQGPMQARFAIEVIQTLSAQDQEAILFRNAIRLLDDRLPSRSSTNEENNS